MLIMAAPIGFIQAGDHQYCKNAHKAKAEVPEEAKERCASIFYGCDHQYSKPGNKRKYSTPTGKTPKQPSKRGVVSGIDERHKTVWTEDEKEFLKGYIEKTPKGTESLTTYWNLCADALNKRCLKQKRSGHSCKSLSQRMFLVPTSSVKSPMSADTLPELTEMEMGCSLIPPSTSVEVGTQTDLTLPVNSTHTDDRKVGDWVFMEPKKELKKNASSGAEILNKAALKRLRRYPDMKSREKACLINLICTGSSQQTARAIMSSSFADEIRTLMIYDIEMDARECSTKGSVLCRAQYKDLLNFRWADILNELVGKQSLLAEVLLAVALPTGKIGNTKATETLVPVLSMVYGMLMKQRFHELSAIQKFVSVALANEQTHQKVYDRLQPLGVSLSHQGMLETMTRISGSFNVELIDSVKNGKRFRLVGDNINFHIGVAQARKSVGKTGHMEHWFGSAAVVQNVCFADLPDNAQQCDLRQVPSARFLLSENEWNGLVFNMSLLASRILTEFFPWLKFAKAALEERTDEVPEGMKMANKVIPLTILHKNEQKYADVVDILDTYQEVCETTYEATGENAKNVHIGGDLLTRERFSGAKKLRAGALTETERLENLNPITFELFHLQMTVLAAFYQILYNTQSTEPFTLHSQKVRLLRKDVDGNDVKNHYDSCRELAVSVIKAYVVEAACEQFGLPDIETVPGNLPDYQSMSNEEIRLWLVNQVVPIVTRITSASREVVNGTNVDRNMTDTVNCYANTLLELGLVYMELCDSVKVPNRNRLLSLMKYLLLMLKGHNNHSKYALDILRFLCQQTALLSERRANEVFCGLFVNTGKTIIPADLQMEYLVRLTKCHLRSMCSNVTDQSLAKRSSAFFGMDELSKKFDEETSTVKRSQKHKRLSSVDDEKKILKDLRAVKPFLETPGRQAVSVKKQPKSPISKLNMDAFIKWIEKYKVKFYYEL